MPDEKGTDLDKRTEPRRPPSAPAPAIPAAPPPPPPPSRQPRRPASTQIGIGVPPPIPPGSRPSGAVPAAMAHGRPPSAVPPPPPPPARSLSDRAAPPPPPPPSTAQGLQVPPTPSPAGGRNTADMDWDDDEERTHIYESIEPKAKDASHTSNASSAPNAPNANKSAVGPLPAAAPPPKATGPSGPPPLAPRADRVSTAPVRRTQSGASHQATAPRVPSNPPALQQVPSIVVQSRPPAFPPPTRHDATQIRQQKSNAAPLIMAGLALAAAVGVASYLFISTRHGSLVVSVDVKPPGTKVRISVDGAIRCESDTCKIEDISAGDHILKATAGEGENIAETKAQVTVKAGRESLVQLKLELVARRSAIKIAAGLPGQRVTLDGGEPRQLPLEETVKPGEHRLRFLGPSDQYGSRDSTIVVEEGRVVEISDVKVPLRFVRVRFEVATKGARVKLSDGANIRDLTDGKVEELDTTKTWTVLASAPKLQDFSRLIDFGDNKEMTFRVELVKPGQVEAPATAARVAVRAHGHAAAPVTAPATATPAAHEGGGEADHAAATPAVSNDGQLFINTLPPSKCAVNGTPRGQTPLTLKVPAGSYSVTCVAHDGEETLKKTGQVDVVSGDKANLILKLRE